MEPCTVMPARERRSRRHNGLLTLVAALVLGLVGLGSGPAQAAAVPVDATAAQDFSGDGRADIVVPTGDGLLWLYRGDGAGGFSGARSQLGTGWNSRDQIRLVG